MGRSQSCSANFGAEKGAAKPIGLQTALPVSSAEDRPEGALADDSERVRLIKR